MILFNQVIPSICSQAAADNIVGMLWRLMEAGLEELRLLQTATLLLTINTVVQHEALAKVRLFVCLRSCHESCLCVHCFVQYLFVFLEPIISIENKTFE